LELLQAQYPGLILGISLCFAMSFGLKAGIFPLYSWLPASYHTPPVLISAVFAGLLTKVGVFAFFRVFTLVFPPNDWFFYSIGVIAGLTMLMGVIGAVAQKDIRRILSFHIISQIGYMMLGLALLQSEDASVRVLGLSAAIFFIVHNIFAKTNLFLIGGIIERHAGTQELKKLGGFLEKAPLLAILFLISALALAGLPPLSGFWAKLGVIQASFRAEAYWLGGIALFTSILTLVSMLKIWNQAFWAPESEPKEIKKLSRSENFSFYFPVIILASLTFVMGIRPQLIFDFTQIAAVQMQDPSLYRSVLGLKLMEDPSNVESGEEQNP
jgi:multicomponent Na+:H+ antiporter subunit D